VVGDGITEDLGINKRRRETKVGEMQSERMGDQVALVSPERY
jgi:hypothetical protein